MQKHLLLSTASALLLAAFTAPAVYAQSSGASDADVEEVVVTGTRRLARSAADSPAPVDVISGSDFVNQSDGDLSNLLRTVVPSYNVNAQPISDAATLIRPANLRGLAPDQTLVLVNSKRRHRAAVISFLGGGISDGAQGPDISVIPAIALKRVEILRDGAAAQYGSDAIAGVINFILKDDREGMQFEAKYGSTFEGDGDQLQLAANAGFAAGENGFLNLSAEWRQEDPTSRSVQRDDALGLIADGNTAVRSPAAQVWGTPEIDNDVKLFMNFAVEASDNAEIYAFGNYAERTVEGGFFFRNPNTRGGVNSADGGTTRLVGDMTPGDGITCTGGINFDTGVIDDPLVIGSAGEAAAMAAISADPNCFVFNEMFPGGFTPFFGGDVNDVSMAGGVRGELDNGVHYDISAHAGRNQADFRIRNTVNASLGSLTPNTFDLGSYVQLEKNINADFSYPLDVEGFASPLNVAGGFEWREEQFQIITGQPESFKAGILGSPIDIDGAGPIDPISQGFGVGANGFNGFSDQAAGTNDRTNVAAYIDLEADVTEKLILGAALRFEDYSDFGSTTNYKFTGLFKATDGFRIRSSYSTGFRAPTVGQQQVINVSTVFENVGGVLQLAQRGTIPPTNPIAVLKGAKPLTAENSKSFTFGFSADLGQASLTVDYFNIKVTDRITQSASQTLDDAERDALVASGVGFAADLSAFRFFVNDFDTKTQGIDVVFNMPLDFGTEGSTALVWVGNYTKTEVTKFNPVTMDALRIQELTEQLPQYRSNLSLTHNADSWRALVRANYYGSYTEAHVGSQDLNIYAGSEITLDAEVGYNVMESVELILGASNLFNNYPDANPFSGVVGAAYPVASPMGFNGGAYYVKVRANF